MNCLLQVWRWTLGQLRVLFGAEVCQILQEQLCEIGVTESCNPIVSNHTIKSGIASCIGWDTKFGTSGRSTGDCDIIRYHHLIYGAIAIHISFANKSPKGFSP